MTASTWWLVGVVAAAAAVAVVLTRALSLPSSRFAILDLPNERSLHQRPTPRTGGLAICVAIVLGWSGVAIRGGLPAGFVWIAGGAVAVAAVSFADDRGGIAARWRLLVHLGAAAMLVAGDLTIDRVPWPGATAELGAVAGAAVTVLFVVWMTNLYNFMDGMDGFAGGMAVAGFGFLGYAFHASGQVAVAAASLVVAGGALGFLRYNFPPARIFLGDVGAAPLGFLAAALMLHGEASAAIPLWASVAVFSPFIVDATVTLVRRLLRREKVWQAHRTHFYQRLVQLGWGHRRTVLWEYAAMLICGAAAVAVLHATTQTQSLILAAIGVAYLATMLLITRLERAR